MEPLLDVLWLLLALASVGVWVQRHHHGAKPGRSAPLRELLALGCVLVLLVPVISAKDDWSYDQFALTDTWATSKGTLKAATSGRVPAYKHPAPAATLLASAQNPLWQILGLVPAEYRDLFSSAPAVPRAGRAPPSL